MSLTTRYVLFDAKPIKAATMAASGSIGFEIGYYFAFAYLRLLPSFGIYAGSGTAGIVLLGLAGLLILKHIKRMPPNFLLSILFPLLIVLFMTVINIFFHRWFWQNSRLFFISQLITWIAETILISYLVTRPGFVKRLILFMFMSVIVLMPFATYGTEGARRLRFATSGFLANSNDLAAWLGFCAICLVMWSFSTPSLLKKLILAAMGVVCFGLIALTVSRASMFLAIGVIAQYLLLRTVIMGRGMSTLLTILVVGILIAIILAPSIDSIVANYNTRLTEDTGRNLLWELALPRVLANPFGSGTFYVYSPYLGYIGPHNVFLSFGLISGWIPMILLAIYYVVAAFKMRKTALYEGFLWVPGLFLYCFFEHNQSNGYIFELWSVVTLALCIIPFTTEAPLNSRSERRDST